MRIRPSSVPELARALCSSMSTSARMVRVRASTSSPLRVRKTPLRLRSTSFTPRWFSISMIWAESAGWLTWTSSAALPKWRAEARASK
ncbi:hypothetical protein D9M72_626530 [compost metagenome]